MSPDDGQVCAGGRACLDPVSFFGSNAHMGVSAPRSGRRYAWVLYCPPFEPTDAAQWMPTGQPVGSQQCIRWALHGFGRSLVRKRVEGVRT